MRLQSLTAIFLILLYGIVGLTGESLHYLVQEGFSSAQVADKDTELSEHSHGYHHCHGPDYHWHYHASPKSNSKQDAAEHSTRNKRIRELTGVVLKSPAENSHEPHSCPLLALIANLRLGAGGHVVVELEHRPLGATQANYEPLMVQTTLENYLARGPPWQQVA